MGGYINCYKSQLPTDTCCSTISYFDLLASLLCQYWSDDQQHSSHFFQSSLHKDSMPHNKEGTLHIGKLLHLLVGLHKSIENKDQHLYEVQGGATE